MIYGVRILNNAMYITYDKLDLKDFQAIKGSTRYELRSTNLKQHLVHHLR